MRTKTDSCSKCEDAGEARSNKLINCNNSEVDSKVSIRKILNVDHSCVCVHRIRKNEFMLLDHQK